MVNQIHAVKLTASKSHASATVVITNDDDDDTAGEALLDLIVGSNELTVTVTAEDTTDLADLHGQRGAGRRLVTHHPGQQHASEFEWHHHRLYSSELRNWRHHRWLHGLRG